MLSSLISKTLFFRLLGKLFSALGFAGLLIWVGSFASVPASAQTFNYVGNPFVTPGCGLAQCYPGSIKVSVTFKGIPANFTGPVGRDSVAAWSTQWNLLQVTSVESGAEIDNAVFSFSNGQIVKWFFQIDEGSRAFITTCSFSAWCATPYDQLIDHVDPPVAGQNSNVPGTWALVSAVSPKTFGQSPLGCYCADPINIATGNVSEQVSDYQTAGQNVLGFTRYYNSMAAPQTFATALGTHWRSNFDRYLNLTSSSAVTAERPDGQQLSFVLNAGIWTPDTDIDYILINSGSMWTLTGPDDTVETYTASGTKGLLQTIKLRNGYTQTMNYTSGQLTSVTDSYNRAISFTYTNNLLTGLTTPDSVAVTYGYSTVSGAGLLTKISYNTSPVTGLTYAYGDTGYPFALTGITDELGNTYSSWNYDSSGRATSNSLGGSLNANLTTFSYDDTTGNRTVTGPLGGIETYKFTTLQGVPKVTEIDRAANGTVAAATRTMSYDSNGYLNSTTDSDGNITTYVNNSHGLPTTINEAFGSSVARTTAIVYDATWVHLPHTITTPGLTTTNNYDSSTGNLLTKVLTDTTTRTVPYSTNGQTRTWTYTYTGTGQLHTVQLPRTDVTGKTTYAYTGGTLTSLTDPLGHVTTINTYTSGGRPLTMTDPNSVLTTLAYDGRLNLHTKVVTITGGSLTTTWTHDAANNLTQLTQPDSTFLTYGYDTAHRLNKITNANGELMPLTLDAAGDVMATLWQTSGAQTTRMHSATFDALGRKLTDIGGMGQTSTYGYDSQGNLTGTKTALTWTTGQTPDALNRIKTITDPYSHTTSTTFDAHDRPLTVTDPNGHVTTYTYDGFGEVISVASPDSGTTVYHYDLDGNVSSKTDGASQVTNLTYDAMDRPLTRKYPADSTLNVAYTYDQTGHGKGIGRLTSLTDQAGSLSLTYDESGNILTNARTIGSTVYTTSYSYNGQRTVKTITYPTAGWIATYARDAAGQVTGVTATQPGHSAVSLVSSVTHLPFGPVSSLSWGNGVTHVTNFDADYRQTGLTDKAASAIQSLAYAYDADNNLHTIMDAITAANSQTLGYDHLERLTSAVSGTGGYGPLSYGYDNNGNRTSAGGTSYTISPTSNRVTAIGSASVSYFGTGNISAIGTASMTYNKANQLATASAAGNSGMYGYDAFGQRLKVQPPSGPLQVYN
jgi:YD repeat-containing protein